MLDADIATHAGISDVHHSKTISFSELTDTATDAQIPDDITVNYAKDADTVDGVHAVTLEESAEIDADIAAHAGIPDVHHSKTISFSEMTDTAADAQIPDTITVNQAANADTVDGAHAADLEESVEIDADIAAHAGISDVHHSKTTSFLELTDTATDAQIPDNIMIDYAQDADTVDGAHAVDLEESAEIDADISAHAGDVGVHHSKTSSFSELTDTATDAQIPNDITIDTARYTHRVRAVATLPVSGTEIGEVYYNMTDAKLYVWGGSAWLTSTSAPPKTEMIFAGANDLPDDGKDSVSAEETCPEGMKITSHGISHWESNASTEETHAWNTSITHFHELNRMKCSCKGTGVTLTAVSVGGNCRCTATCTTEPGFF